MFDSSSLQERYIGSLLPASLRTSRPISRHLFVWIIVGIVCLTQIPVCASATIDVYYAPEDQPIDRVVDLYAHATRYIYVSVYALTAPSVVKALVAAKHRGVDVRVITDRERLTDPKQKRAVHTLRLAGVPIMVNRHDGLMHLKQTVIDDVINTSGSANHTTSGNRYNDERLDVITDAWLTAKAREKFLTMWNDHERFVLWTQ
ncbi:MAG: phospholipase D-like domain-containing protein [Nitrospira sp.]|nr:phospholipase D-like domain-containing protein [Nitrospira sp.]